MSLQDARMPRLADKLEEQAKQVEEVREGLEEKDLKDEKIIKKVSKKR